MQDLIEKIKPHFKGSGMHGLDHAIRVHRVGKFIAEKEGAKVNIVEAACLLHDVGKSYETKDTCHAKIGSEMVPELLRAVGFEETLIGEVQYCVLVHRYSEGIIPRTIEAKIVQDSDRLEEIGAIALSRGIGEDIAYGKPLYYPEMKPNEKYKSGTIFIKIKRTPIFGFCIKNQLC